MSETKLVMLLMRFMLYTTEYKNFFFTHLYNFITFISQSYY